MRIAVLSASIFGIMGFLLQPVLAVTVSLRDVETIPYVLSANDKIRKEYARFVKARPPKAWVMASSGSWRWDRGEGAIQDALKNCRSETLATCVVWARDDEITWTVDRDADSFADEDADWGVKVVGGYRDGKYHAPTPTTAPGAKVISTNSLKGKLNSADRPVVIDLLDGA